MNEDSIFPSAIVNGAWREWGAYGSCSKTCGGGTRVRHRQCTAPRPSHGGKDCPGVSSESISCNQQLCASKYVSETEALGHVTCILKSV